MILVVYINPQAPFTGCCSSIPALLLKMATKMQVDPVCQETLSQQELCTSPLSEAEVSNLQPEVSWLGQHLAAAGSAVHCSWRLQQKGSSPTPCWLDSRGSSRGGALPMLYHTTARGQGEVTEVPRCTAPSLQTRARSFWPLLENIADDSWSKARQIHHYIILAIKLNLFQFQQ